ncbi:protein kinase C1 [Crepidotus variabilis]|uniref:protein kinase C n=1 Tax=Crepidotus variabilis TaxID=179855 RepID=A0A9P6ET47_9AGAR|nr:protein kinase C1 [Crepidotus variabilis]
MSQELDQKIAETWKHIQTERKILEASQLLRQATSNQNVLKQNDAKIRETERSLAYFEETLRDLQSRKAQLTQRDDPSRFPGGQPPQVPPKDPTGRGRFSNSPEQGRSSQGSLSKDKQYTNLDLIKADTPFTPKKISKMLHQLEFKHQVELQYKKGIEKMAKLYQADGDKRSKADAEAKRFESDRKIQLLLSALKRYKNLHILDDVEDDEETDNTGNDGERKDKLRSKPVSGTLYVTLKGARDLDHAPIVTSRYRSNSKVVETSVSIKVEGTQLAKSHPSRTDRWNEDFEISVDKANEIEIAVYDKQVSEPNAVPIGLLWIRINDLVDALRRQKVGMDAQGGGWVTAGAMPGDSPTAFTPHGAPGGHGGIDAPLGMGGGAGAAGGPGSGFSGQGSDGIDAWFAVEPAGALALNLNFVKENVRKRMEGGLGGLGRQGAVKKRKGEVHEMNGHKFIQKQFYQIMLCAFCGDFLLNAVGYQCEDCRYTCHKKCYEKVVTKCISKSTAGEGDEDKINHRIPHRFEPLTNMGANWCCHCGYMLPLGRKNSRKCSECDITCHANCAHFVPDFCGMSMEMANTLLESVNQIRKARGEKAAKPPRQYSTDQTHTASPSLDGAMGQMKLTAPSTGLDPFGRPSSVPPPSDRYQDNRYYDQQPPPQTPSTSSPVPPYGSQRPPGPPPGARVPVTPGFPHDPATGRMSGAYDVPPPGQPPSGMDGGYGPSSPPYQQTPLPPQRVPVPTGPAPVQPRPMPGISGPPGQPGRPSIERPGSVPVPQVSRPTQPPQQQPPTRQSTRKRKVGLDDFNFLAVLGKGNFGKVMLAEEKKTSLLYAIKVLKKEFIIDNDEVESTRSEKRVFLAAARERHPFLLGLHSCFQTETRVYFVMEYVSGGDLMLHIQRKQFSLRQAKFYAAEVLLALEYFHANGIIYRDLKLDNILLTLDGHVKVADYGLCKEEMWYGQTTSTFCGTPEFMAPEILLEQRYGRAVDWWAFGVLTYEMLLGQSPFRGEDEDEIFDAILEDEPLYPITMPRDAVSILQKLLTRDPNRRLGSGKDDAEEIKKQPFFKDTNWDDVVNKRIPPPYFPTINGSADTSNFDEEFTREQPTLTPVHGQLSARDQQEFNGFSWVANWADI